MYRAELTHKERQIACFLKQHVRIFGSLVNDEFFREFSFKVDRVYKMYTSNTGIRESLKDTKGKNMFLICFIVLLTCSGCVC